MNMALTASTAWGQESLANAGHCGLTDGVQLTVAAGGLGDDVGDGGDAMGGDGVEANAVEGMSGRGPDGEGAGEHPITIAAANVIARA